MITREMPEPDVPFLDEGWWHSVLAEDEISQDQSARTVLESQRAACPLDWSKALRLFREDEIIEMEVTGFNRGGLLVEGDDVAGFVPCSHLVNLPVQMNGENREECLSGFLGRRMKLKIIECVQEEGRLVFSERAARAGAGKRTEIFSNLQPGQRVFGEVTNVTDFGVFVDLGGVEGLIHISELSWGRVAHPGQILQVGQNAEVMVLDVSPERCRIALSLKRLMKNPWENVEAQYPLDRIVTATITALVPFGAFARLEEGLEGLIHTTEIPLPPNMALEDFLVPGQTVQVRILQVDGARQRLGLSMKIN